MSAGRKLLLGPVPSLACRSCGQRVGVEAVRAYASFVPCLLVVLEVRTRMGVASMIAAGVAALAFTCVLYLQWVPLVKRQVTDRDAMRRALDGAGPPPRG